MGAMGAMGAGRPHDRGAQCLPGIERPISSISTRAHCALRDPARCSSPDTVTARTARHARHTRHASSVPAPPQSLSFVGGPCQPPGDTYAVSLPDCSLACAFAALPPVERLALLLPFDGIVPSLLVSVAASIAASSLTCRSGTIAPAAHRAVLPDPCPFGLSTSPACGMEDVTIFIQDTIEKRGRCRCCAVPRSCCLTATVPKP